MRWILRVITCVGNGATPDQRDGRTVSLRQWQFHVHGASIGIVGYPEDRTQQEILLQIADQAMYEVKRSGKNRYAYARTEPASAHTRST